MKRSGPPKRKTPLKRSGSLSRPGPSRTTAKAAKPAELQRARPKRAAKARKTKLPRIPKGTLCWCCQKERAVHWHHGIRESVINDYDGNAADPRILLPVGFLCHQNGHWSAFKRWPVTVLPDSVFEFAYDLLGPKAYDEIRRHYEGDDPRLTALLREA